MSQDLANLKRQLHQIVNTDYLPNSQENRKHNKSSDSIYMPHSRNNEEEYRMGNNRMNTDNQQF